MPKTREKKPFLLNANERICKGKPLKVSKVTSELSFWTLEKKTEIN